MAWFRRKQQEIQLAPITIERLWDIFQDDPSESILDENRITTIYRGYGASMIIPNPNILTIALANPISNFPRDQVAKAMNWASSWNLTGTVGTSHVEFSPDKDFLMVECYHTFFIQEGATEGQLVEWLLVGFENETKRLNDFCNVFGVEPYYYREENI
ncbi:hypothetical protein [Corynebacterium freiburgense]|uniref:hypothetical protein n=1 Tax=Corynebacterium freiburgense TaxID=556548 RepID=UPI00047D30B6|nr:hypothetical protein [Corynebacterium freiburgense]WJZ02995.1 hypothetical protein CFREI_08585 [Corynebacterium freiburgense]